MRYEEIEVELTEEDAKLGKPCNSTWCPFALAFKRRFPQHDISVGTNDVTVSIGNKSVFYTPKDFNFVQLLTSFDLFKQTIPTGNYKFIGGF